MPRFSELTLTGRECQFHPVVVLLPPVVLLCPPLWVVEPVGLHRELFEVAVLDAPPSCPSVGRGRFQPRSLGVTLSVQGSLDSLLANYGERDLVRKHRMQSSDDDLARVELNVETCRREDNKYA